jgi:hypothetical protein
VGYAGNSVTVFVDPLHRSAQISTTGKELRYFKMIVLAPAAVSSTVEVRVFDP